MYLVINNIQRAKKGCMYLGSIVLTKTAKNRSKTVKISEYLSASYRVLGLPIPEWLSCLILLI